jgi:hypothetical protein
VVTAGHCVDTDGNGHIVDISQPFSVSGKGRARGFQLRAQPRGSWPRPSSRTPWRVDAPGLPGFRQLPLRHHDRLLRERRHRRRCTWARTRRRRPRSTRSTGAS